MEISSFPFLTQQDFYSWPLLDMDNALFPTTRRRRDDDFNNSGFTTGVLSSLLLLDDEVKQEEPDNLIAGAHQEGDQPPVLFGSRPAQKSQDMNFDNSREDLDESRPKRARKSVPVAVAEGECSGQGSGQHRWLWVKDRSKDWWERCSHRDFPDEDFRRDFRMSKSPFNMICEELPLRWFKVPLRIIF